MLSKVYERIIYSQLLQNSAQFLNSFLCGDHKVHSTQHEYFKLLHSWQRELSKGGLVVKILMDLSKACDCISHELLIAKLQCYGLDEISLKLILNYLCHRKQRIKIEIKIEIKILGLAHTLVSRGSRLGQLLFNTFINNLFFNAVKSQICNFADDNTLHSFDKKLDTIFFKSQIWS